MLLRTAYRQGKVEQVNIKVSYQPNYSIFAGQNNVLDTVI